MDAFQKLIWDLGEITEIALHVDELHACKLVFEDKYPVQMEMDPHSEYLIIASKVVEVPPGKFRENVLKEGLKVNGEYHPFGFLAYHERDNSLVLYNKLVLERLTGEKLADFIELFVEEVDKWYEALTGGIAAPAEYINQGAKAPSPFDLKPK